ncbi:hypothetical protein [Aestuariivivens sediminis]|uniref:hypothetical protein n=1 Tax=Aestuariivivens sediminis TaxID=2913557 RepID=UPI001F57E8FC|nr:hypothetical protein [Aestuariivivens sediminis]
MRDKLANGEIDLESAQAEYWKDFKEEKRSWHTKDWKERRAKIIKDKCEICGSKETLTLQHRSHPKRYSEYLREIKRAYANEYIDNNSKIDKSKFRDHILENYVYIAISLCPNCMGKNPNMRVSKNPRYRCTECKHEFDMPIHRSAMELISIFYEDENAHEVRDRCFMSKDKWKNFHNLSNVRYWYQREKAINKDDKKIEEEAFLLYLNDIIHYLSFDDTMTACKRCAFNHDINRTELCPECKQYYKGLQYPTCIKCLPEEKRKAVTEIIEFGNEMREMHKRLGID